MFCNFGCMNEVMGLPPCVNIQVCCSLKYISEVMSFAILQCDEWCHEHFHMCFPTEGDV
jgi:hypothetical protein